jgi:hypothetical protein
MLKRFFKGLLPDDGSDDSLRVLLLPLLGPGCEVFPALGSATLGINLLKKSSFSGLSGVVIISLTKSFFSANPREFRLNAAMYSRNFRTDNALSSSSLSSDTAVSLCSGS